MSNLNVARLVNPNDPSSNVITPRGRLLYPALFKARLMKGETDQSKAKFGCSLLIPKGSDIKALKEAYNTVLSEQAASKRTGARSPFLVTADQPRFAEFAEEYPLLLRFNANMAPDVVTPKGDRNVKEEEEPDEVYMGRWARVTCRAFWYDQKGNRGVSFGLQNVQLLDHDEPIAGGRVRGTSEFEAVEEDALSDMTA